MQFLSIFFKSPSKFSFGGESRTELIGIFPFTFLWRTKKSNKRNPPCAAESSLTRWFAWRGQKLALYSGVQGFVIPILFIIASRFIGIYPLRQFAPVFHENHQVRAASQWAPHRRKSVAFSSVSGCCGTGHWRVGKPAPR